MSQPIDCVVIGGGPAGSTAANLLASHGHSVVVLEREHFPRYHIGESLLPGVLPMLDVLGAREEVEAFGFEKKSGQTFFWNPKDDRWELNFHELERFSYSYFVTRADFDHILLKTAKRKGAEVREGCRVREVRFDGDRAVGVTYEDEAGQSHTLDSRFVIDASGSQALLAKHFRLRRFTEEMKSFAVWSYFRGFKRMEGRARQHILTATFRDGWIWCIPLHNGSTNVGIVTARDLVPRGLNKEKREAWYEEILRSVPAVWERLEDAERTDGLTTARDWAYRCTKRCGPGWVLAGEASGFIDPLLSYGVQFALNSAYMGALVVHNALEQPALEGPFLQYGEDTTRSLYEDLYAAVQAFYSYESSQDSVYWRTKELVGRERGMTAYKSFLYVTSGLLRNEAFGGQSEEDTLGLVGLHDTDEQRTRQGAVDESVPGELAPDILVGGAAHVVARGIPLPDAGGAIRLHDLVREGFQLTLTAHKPPQEDESDGRLATVEVATPLPDGRVVEVKIYAFDREASFPRYAEVGGLAVGYLCVPRSGSSREHDAVLAVVDHVTATLGRLDADGEPRSSLSTRLIDALAGADALPAGSHLLTQAGSDTHEDEYRALVLGLQNEDDPHDALWFFVQDRQVAEEKTWTRTRSYALSYQPSHLLDGTPLFDSPSHRAACAFAADRLHRLDDGPGQGLDGLAARLQTDLGTRIVPPAPWRFVEVEGISRSGAPKKIWQAPASAISTTSPA